ncbi:MULTISPECIES: hypothetical protein [unclassified Pseudoalteromonas]|uniref:hypothetical protein n=1 Tax=unclassified Pseudoalteromonas TaxID=194690 RepID=UPI0025B4EA1A|nr:MULTISPECIES: hypothetical protein [unclassified Pseudoalteromonas]MDN3377178.1 hypothetical protein [Pseudoalteromonas sp. APC 3893]MDN3385654.1 hypothetical protein [Pseudoalteromonas sp. APC 4017]
MTLLTQAQQLLQQTPYTLQTCREFAKLEQQAKGQEANQIADLLPALIAGLDQQTHMQAFDEGIV